LLKSTSTVPKRWRAAAIIAAIDALWVTSACT
jgi:hypothetical protein